MSSLDSMALSPYTNQESPTNSMGELRITTLTPPTVLSSVSTQSANLSQAEQTPKETTTRSRKKSKPKSQPKTRTIKFHEYKVNIFFLMYLKSYWRSCVFRKL